MVATVGEDNVRKCTIEVLPEKIPTNEQETATKTESTRKEAVKTDESTPLARQR